MNIIGLPDSLLVFLFFNWLDLKNVGNFDVAICSKKDRQEFLNALLFEKQSIEQFVNVVEKNYNIMIFHKWLLDRGVTLKKIMFETARCHGNLKVRKWLSSGIYQLKTTELVTHLRFVNIDMHRDILTGRRRCLGFDQFPELQQSVSGLINQCKKSLKSLHFVDCGVCDQTLISGMDGMALTEMIIEDKIAVGYTAVDGCLEASLVGHLLKFNCLTTLKLQFCSSRTCMYITQHSIVSMLKVNRNLTHLDLEKVMIIDDSFLSTVSTQCKELRQFLCSSTPGPANRFPSASAISDYIRAPHKSLQLVRLRSSSNFHHPNFQLALATENPSAGTFSFDFNKEGEITASVTCTKETVKSIFVGMEKVKTVAFNTYVGDLERVYTVSELAHI
jgi:hypothetical protein